MDMTLITAEAKTYVDNLVANYRNEYPNDAKSMVLANLVECAAQEFAFIEIKNPIAATASEARSARYQAHAKSVSATMTPDEIEVARRVLVESGVVLADWI
jgi:hypothetical protein